MHDARVLLIGGTSNVGKSTVARVLAEKLGFRYQSTDKLARHPGRPWRTPDWEVPPHVADHYASLTVDELITSVLDHYARLWPRVEDLITTSTGTGLVLEGSALWPARVAELTIPRVGAVWLTADNTLVRDRIRTAGHYKTATPEERHLMDKFLARTERYQALMNEAIDELGLDRIDTGTGLPVTSLADSVLATIAAQHTTGRSPQP